MRVIRYTVLVALLVTVAYGSRLGLVVVLGYLAAALELLRREVFQQAEEQALGRLRAYWHRLQGESEEHDR